MANAIGYVASIVALVLTCRGHTTSARAVLRLAFAACRHHGSTHRFLLSPMGAPFHALTLLELGDYKTVLAAVAAGELETQFRRFLDTGTADYLRGRALAAAAQTPGDREAALGPLRDCLQQAEANGFKWWRAATLLEIGQLEIALGHEASGQAALQEAFERAKEHGFQLIKIDARLALAAELERTGAHAAARRHRDEAARESVACGYGLRRH